MLALVKIRFVKGVVPPTAPENETTPAVPAWSVNAVAPLIVLETVEKLIFAPAGVPVAFVVSRVIGVVKTTGPAIVMIPPALVKFPFKLMAVDAV